MAVWHIIPDAIRRVMRMDAEAQPKHAYTPAVLALHHAHIHYIYITYYIFATFVSKKGITQLQCWLRQQEIRCPDNFRQESAMPLLWQRRPTLPK